MGHVSSLFLLRPAVQGPTMCCSRVEHGVSARKPTPGHATGGPDRRPGHQPNHVTHGQSHGQPHGQPDCVAQG